MGFLRSIWRVPKIRGTFLGVPIIRTILFWGSILGSPYLGKLPFATVYIWSNWMDHRIDSNSLIFWLA